MHIDSLVFKLLRDDKNAILSKKPIPKSFAADSPLFSLLKCFIVLYSVHLESLLILLDVPEFWSPYVSSVRDSGTEKVLL